MSQAAFVPFVRLADAMRDEGLTAQYVAASCGVGRAALDGWRKRGTVPTRFLPALVRATGRPLPWWVDGTPYADAIRRDLDGV